MSWSLGKAVGCEGVAYLSLYVCLLVFYLFMLVIVGLVPKFGQSCGSIPDVYNSRGCLVDELACCVRACACVCVCVCVRGRY